MRRVLYLFISLLAISSNSQALIFHLPANGENVVGQLQYYIAQQGDTLSNFGMALDVGRDALKASNLPFGPGQELPAGVPVVVPSRFVLPPYPHKGIVVDLSTMRLYYYPPGTHLVMTYPIGIGKPGHMTPLGRTYVTRKKIDPTWTPPQSIRDYNKKRGIILPRVIRGGPDNPLGRRAIYLAIPQYLIHATNFPASIGSRGSFGCMRMMERDIEQLFPHVAKKTRVRIVEEPYLAGWANGQLYLEIHKPLNENRYKPSEIMKPVIKQLTKLSILHHVAINWTKVRYAFSTANGIPTVVSNSWESEVGYIHEPQAQHKWPKQMSVCKLSGNC